MQLSHWTCVIWLLSTRGHIHYSTVDFVFTKYSQQTSHISSISLNIMHNLVDFKKDHTLNTKKWPPSCRRSSVDFLYETWWRHQMETFSVFVALCEGNSPVTSEFPSQRLVTWSLMFYLISAWTNGWANHRDAGNLRRHQAYYDVTVMIAVFWFSLHQNLFQMVILIIWICQQWFTWWLSTTPLSVLLRAQFTKSNICHSASKS